MKRNRIWRVAGISFEHFHMGDLLRMAFEHPRAEIVGICDEQPARMRTAIRNFAIPPERVFSNFQACLEKTRPDLIILCPATARHAWFVEQVAPYGAHLLVEKPFASTLGEADRMIAAARAHRVKLAINWALRWVPAHVTAHRLLNEGVIGELQEVHYYGGDRGPLRHGADKVETRPGPKARSWFYQRKSGGGSLLDYLGYGATFGNWYHNGAKPIEVMCMVDEPRGLEVDEQSITVARYRCGLSQFETRWGTFTDPWTHQPQPKCGFILKGTGGTISSYDYEPSLRVQTRRRPEGYEQPADRLTPPFANPIQYFIHCLETGAPLEGPLSPPVSRIGQQIVDAAVQGAWKQRAVKIV
jgi:glucose-fructose oxidoreductase